ncbi:MAG: primosomal protein N' [Acidobacteria bacterium]|nr:primosomal protein N' [Acidobacteriota bacterium]
MHKPAAEISQIPEFVEVALPIPLRQTFTYRLPESLAERVRLGARLIVPFKTRQLTGYAVALHTSLDPELAIDPKLIKNVAEIVDDEPLINEEILKLTQWTADYYASSWGEVLRASLPAGINSNVEETVVITESGRAEESKFEVPKTNKQQILRELAANGETGRKYFEKHLGKSTAMRTLRDLANLGLVSLQRKQVRAAVSKKTRLAVRLTDTDSSGKKISESQQRILDLLATRGEMFQTELVEAAKVNQSPVSTLAKNGLVEIFEKEMLRDPFRDSSVPAFVPIKLTDRQASVLESINQAQKSERYKAFLLHGVTGSGKTEIYIRAMNFARDNGKSALMLVPEIALTPVFSKRLRAVFGDDVAILHSNLSSGERFDEWRRIRRGDARIVIGTRSAVFAPLANIGLLIVDEEHDGSYRQNEAPYYNGRDVAVVRASFANAVVVLGSATPALETFRNSEIGKYEYLSLPKRIGNRPMAAAEIVDMRNVFRTAGKDLSFSAELIEAIEETHSKGEQSIILLNRRGFSQFVLCRSCGESMRCRNCDITLTYHRRDVKLICHYCNHREKVPQTCPKCESKYLYFMGEGTEQIEDQLKRRFSHLRITRVDRDTTARRQDMESILDEFSRGSIDMLVGTQMLAKGHDFHNVTLVGVISVDAGLAMPDFRSGERTFQLLTQVAGRAGRGELPGRVIIQTYYPDHYILRHAHSQDYGNFYAQEVEFRRRLGYPPFVSLAGIMIKHPNYAYAFDNAQILKECLVANNRDNACRILGPAPAPLSRLKNEFRLQILVKAANRTALRETLDFALAAAQERFCDLRIVSVEIDPLSLL